MGSRVARAKWSSSADFSYNFAIVWYVVVFSSPKIEGDIDPSVKKLILPK